MSLACARPWGTSRETVTREAPNSADSSRRPSTSERFLRASTRWMAVGTPASLSLLSAEQAATKEPDPLMESWTSSWQPSRLTWTTPNIRRYVRSCCTTWSVTKLPLVMKSTRSG